MQQQMQNQTQQQPPITPMPSTAPNTNSATQPFSGASVEFLSPNDKNESSCDDE